MLYHARLEIRGKEYTCYCRRCKKHGFSPWVGKMPWRRAWQPTPVFLPGEAHGQRNLVGHSPWGPKEPDTTEGLSHGNSIHEEAFSKTGCTVLRSPSSVRGFQCLHVLTETSYLFLRDDTCPGGDVGSRRGLDLYFPQDYDVEGLFHVLIGHLCIFAGEMSIQIICTF